jgi:predicted lactoylglutathione lyase
MPTMIFVNLPVKDLERSVKFFTELGFTFNPQFTDATAACMVVTETIYVMLLTEAKFQAFTPKPVADARQSTEMLLALAMESRAAVEALVQQAVDLGGGRVMPNRKTTASCTNMGSRTWTGTSGKSSTWIRAQ